MIELVRRYREDGTFGQLTLEDGAVFFTVERPWLDNRSRVSCIPEGVYRLALRESPVVYRTSREKYSRGWSVTNVPSRSLIMIHVANLPTEVEGCIGVGMKHGFLGGKFATLSSRAAFERLMQKLAVRDEWFIDIKSKKSKSETT